MRKLTWASIRYTNIRLLDQKRAMSYTLPKGAIPKSPYVIGSYQPDASLEDLWSSVDGVFSLRDFFMFVLFVVLLLCLVDPD